MHNGDIALQEVKQKDEALERAIWDVRRVLRYLAHSSENYAYFADDPHLVAAKALAERADKRLTKLNEG